ncbi:hypothetical protein CANTEDRAFT_94746 [Yamadazyma tenuis ATCC 10573]|uniref:Zn(2)-C6 fungal-type domain-containing protein n=1 Tax=Candida tenuis (strain ATCC 10573 / BCRC 21748 / CBS 615 / JCM 9827 / NBRC 10315 / NRRL Y-1498 / VKM Y-70) TaxID=590646 RepID=G3B9F1_CANTC|nr:uncharacterized protein CANTEDRAFT_94746 [Yamadazyma tenuis ATCC 10573]EGV61870.1 hypothetical protein CANTEDRAFT_94746 [Yamadazyma tenuis ATCC 10573]
MPTGQNNMKWQKPNSPSEGSHNIPSYYGETGPYERYPNSEPKNGDSGTHPSQTHPLPQPRPSTTAYQLPPYQLPQQHQLPGIAPLGIGQIYEYRLPVQGQEMMVPAAPPTMGPSYGYSHKYMGQPPRPESNRTSKPRDSPPDNLRPPTSSASSPGSAKAGRNPTKRSRMGCITCRQRKKRCCETRPKCTECSRLRLNCAWPTPGTEHKNKSKELKEEENVMHHEIYGKIKVLRGIVEYKSDEDPANMQ